jgi:hypothetical protein
MVLTGLRQKLAEIQKEEIFVQAVKAWDDHATDQAHVLMQQGIEMAQQTHWIK